MKNVTQWVKELEDLFEGQKNGTIDPGKAVEMNNTVGKFIKLMKLNLEYHEARHKLGELMPKLAAFEEPNPAEVLTMA